MVSVSAIPRALLWFFLLVESDSFFNGPVSIFVMSGFSRYAQNIPMIIGVVTAPSTDSLAITESKLNITITAMALTITAQVA